MRYGPACSRRSCAALTFGRSSMSTVWPSSTTPRSPRFLMGWCQSRRLHADDGRQTHGSTTSAALRKDLFANWNVPFGELIRLPLQLLLQSGMRRDAHIGLYCVGSENNFGRSKLTLKVRHRANYGNRSMR